MKKTLTTAALAVGAAMIAAVATAQTPPETLTWMVLNEINGAYFDRTEPFNRPTLVTRVPDGVIRPVDVSHDGKPDPCAASPEDTVTPAGFSVWLTGADSALSEAWASAPDHWAVIDIATTPARLLSNPACGNDTACPNVRLRWDSRSSRFVPAE